MIESVDRRRRAMGRDRLAAVSSETDRGGGERAKGHAVRLADTDSAAVACAVGVRISRRGSPGHGAVDRLLKRTVVRFNAGCPGRTGPTSCFSGSRWCVCGRPTDVFIVAGARDCCRIECLTLVVGLIEEAFAGATLRASQSLVIRTPSSTRDGRRTSPALCASVSLQGAHI